MEGSRGRSSCFHRLYRPLRCCGRRATTGKRRKCNICSTAEFRSPKCPRVRNSRWCRDVVVMILWSVSMISYYYVKNYRDTCNGINIELNWTFSSRSEIVGPQSTSRALAATTTCRSFSSLACASAAYCCAQRERPLWATKFIGVFFISALAYEQHRETRESTYLNE